MEDIFNLIRNNDIETLQQYLTEKVDFNVHDSFGETPLMHAALEGKEEIVNLLISHNFNVNQHDKFDGTAIMYAAAEGHFHICKIMIENGAILDRINKKNFWTPLMSASVRNHPTIVEYLINNGADIEATDEFGKTALIWACENGSFKSAQKLIELGADIRARDHNDGDCLYYALENDHIELAEYITKEIGFSRPNNVFYLTDYRNRRGQ